MKTQETTATTTTKKPAKAKATKGAAKPAAKAAAAKTPKATKPTKAKPKAKDAARAGSKTAIILDLLRRKEGATIMNEGANKGILVTTADYGPDAYAFANNKPLVLLSGANLLHMLEKHGHKARINSLRPGLTYCRGGGTVICS